MRQAGKQAETPASLPCQCWHEQLLSQNANPRVLTTTDSYKITWGHGVPDPQMLPVSYVQCFQAFCHCTFFCFPVCAVSRQRHAEKATTPVLFSRADCIVARLLSRVEQISQMLAHNLHCTWVLRRVMGVVEGGTGCTVCMCVCVCVRALVFWGGGGLTKLGRIEG